MSIFPKISLRLEVESYLKAGFMNEEVVSVLGKEAAERKFETLLHKLSHPPSFTTVRVNTHLASVQHVKSLLFDELQKKENPKAVHFVFHTLCTETCLQRNVRWRKTDAWRGYVKLYFVVIKSLLTNNHDGCQQTYFYVIA